MKLKFRAWDINNKKLISWKKIVKENMYNIINDDNYIISLCYQNEVYEGDIVHFDYVSDSCYHNYDYGTVQYLNGKFSIRPFKYSVQCSCVESQFKVVGNIFENIYLINQIRESNPDFYKYGMDIKSIIWVFGFQQKEIDYFTEKSNHVPRTLLKEVIKNKYKIDLIKEMNEIKKQRLKRMEKLDIKNKNYYKIYLEVKNNIDEYKKFV